MKQSLDKNSQPPNAPPASLLSILQSGNLPRLFIHDYSEVDVPSFRHAAGDLIDFRAERALVMAQEKDMVVVGAPIDHGYLRYLESLAVGPSASNVLVCEGQTYQSEPLLQRVVRGSSAERIRAFTDNLSTLRLNTFCYDKGSAALCDRLHQLTDCRVLGDGGRPDVTVLSNAKHLMREAALETAVPVAPGECVDIEGFDSVRGERAILRAIGRLPDSKNGAIIRGCVSGGGYDNLILRDGAQGLAEWLEARRHLHLYLVESLLDFDQSPNVQLWIDDSARCSVLAATDQRLNSSSAHIGNRYSDAMSFPKRMYRSALALGNWLGEQGYRGPLGMDFLLPSSTTAEPDHYFVEVNGRINGATYMIALFERINLVRSHAGLKPAAAWISTKELMTSATSFAELCDSLGELIYAHDDRVSGVVPYNPGLLSRGKISFLIVGDELSGCYELERQLAGRLG